MNQTRRARLPAIIIIVLVFWTLAIASYLIGGGLRAFGLLNTMDLVPLGSERGSLWAYVLNVWTWAGLQTVFTIGSLLSSLVAIITALFKRSRE